MLARIRRLGFRKWYERQLVESHLYLVTCFLGIIMIAAAFEVFGNRATLTDVLTALLTGIAGGVAALVGWERYKRIMRVAEQLGQQSVCTQCGAYARFEVVDAGKALQAEPVDIDDPGEIWLKVRCRKCGHEWTL